MSKETWNSSFDVVPEELNQVGDIIYLRLYARMVGIALALTL